MRAVRHVIYLHGFASSPQSSKARRFEHELRARGIGFSCPDLNLPSFETLTTTRMLDDVRRAVAAVPHGPIALVGSSLGGFVAVHAADQDATGRVDRLILLAPAFDFGGNRLRQLGDYGIEEWRRTGELEVFHYAHQATRRVGFALYDDAAGYDAFRLPPGLPTLIFQGRHDATVEPASVERWTIGRPNVDLRLLDDDHQLTASIDDIWRASERFLGLSSANDG